MKLIEFNAAQLTVITGQFLGLIIANTLTGTITNYFQVKPQNDCNRVKLRENSLFYLAGIFLILVACVGQKLYLAVPYKQKRERLSINDTAKVAFASSLLLILIATAIYFSTKLNAPLGFRLLASGIIESFISVAAILPTLLPFIMVGITKIPLINIKSVKFATLLTFLLIVSGIYSLYQDGFVSYIGSQIAKLFGTL